MPRMIWPQTRDVPEKEVIEWAWDTRIDANGIAKRWIAGEASDEEYETLVRTTPRPTLEEAMAELADEGLVTWARER